MGFRRQQVLREAQDASAIKSSRKDLLPPEAHTYKSIVLLSLIICLRKGYAFEHLEQFHLHALLRRALRKVRGNNSSRSLDRLPPVQTHAGTPL